MNYREQCKELIALQRRRIAQLEGLLKEKDKETRYLIFAKR